MKIDADYAGVVPNCIRLTGMKCEDITTKTYAYDAQVRNRSPTEKHISHSHYDSVCLEISHFQCPIIPATPETSIFRSYYLSALRYSFDISSMEHKASDSVADDAGQVFDEIHDGGWNKTDEHNSLDRVRSNCLKSALFHDLHGMHAQYARAERSSQVQIHFPLPLPPPRTKCRSISVHYLLAPYAGRTQH